MRRLAMLTVASLVASLLLPLTAAADEPGEPEDDIGPSAPFEHRFLQKTVAGQELPRHAFDNAAAEASRIPTVGGHWNLIGPTNIGGRIVDLALDPKQKDALYVAAASGGLWRSTDAGTTFAPAWPGDQTQALGAVSTAPDGTVYVGTGEVNPGGGSITYTGTGVYKSTDSGRTWTNIGLRDSGAIGKILIDPRDPNRIFVAAGGSLFNQGGERGVYRTTDGGRHWTRVLNGATDTTGATEVMFDPANPNRMYAVLWDHRRQPNKRSYSGVGSGAYRSTDGGNTWQRLDSLVPAAADLGRIGLGVAPTNPNRLYAIIGRGENSTNTFGGFFVSSDAGATWTRSPDTPTLTNSQSTFAWWFGKIWVNPKDANHLHVAGVSLLTSHDGGLTFVTTPGVHADQHAMMWDPRYPSRVYLGNDGGTYRSDTNGDGTFVKATYEPYTQFYSAAISPQDVTRVSGGAQDNGSLRSWGEEGTFNAYVGGDGEENLINPTNVDNVFACFQYGNCFRSTDGGDTVEDFIDATTADRRNWFTPVQFDPNNPNIVYYGGNRLNRSTDNGVTWTPISPDLTGGPSQDAYPFGTITTVEAAASDPNTIYVGTDDGRIWVTRNLGATWTLVLSGQPWVTRVAVDREHAGTVYATLSGYRSGSFQPHVMVSHNFGASWTDISRNLPQAPVNDIILARFGLLYVATDQGVFVSFAGHSPWLRLGRDLPLVPVDDLEYDPGHNRLVAATFGRGIYQLRAI